MMGSPPPTLELELIQSHIAQKPVLRGEVGCACVAREVSVESGGMGPHTNAALPTKLWETSTSKTFSETAITTQSPSKLPCVVLAEPRRSPENHGPNSLLCGTRVVVKAT